MGTTTLSRKRYVVMNKKESVIQEMFRSKAIMESCIPDLKVQRDNILKELTSLQINLRKDGEQKNIILTENINSLNKEFLLLNSIISTANAIKAEIEQLKTQIITNRG